MTKASVQRVQSPDGSQRDPQQTIGSVKWGCSCRRFKTRSWWRRAKFSKTKSRRGMNVHRRLRIIVKIRLNMAKSA